MTTNKVIEVTQQNATKLTAQPIHSRAMLVSLRLSTWTARKYDKRISNQVAAEHGASMDAGRYNKMLIPGDALSYKAIMQLAGSIRTEHYQNTLAWSDEGWRLLPTANYMKYTEFTRKSKGEFSSLLEDFVQEYPMLRESARVRLNGMYRDEDYPAVSQVHGKFGFYLDFAPLPARGDFRVDLPSEEIRRIESECQSKVIDATKTAMDDCWQRLYTCVKHIQERLGTPDAIFRDSLMSNAVELCDVLQRLNVTGDSNLESMRAEIADYIACQDPDTLRENDTLREDTATLAEDIISRMAAFYTPQEEASK